MALTYDCQFQCYYCGSASYPRDNRELSIRDWKKIIDQLSEMKVPEVEFSGGEPLLNDCLEELVYYASGRGLVTVISTNGWALTEDRIDRLKECGVNCICISLDGASPEVHDNICLKKGSFQRVIKAIELCRQKRICCVISTILRRELIASFEFEKLLLLIEDMGANGIRLVSPLAVGRWLGEDEQILTVEEKDKARDAVRRHAVPVIGRGFNYGVCGATTNYSAYISPSAEVQPCGYIPYSFGNATQEIMAPILQRISSHEMFKKRGRCRIEDPGFRNTYLRGLRSNTGLPVKLY